jgi:tetratricopeptide (TPR) repeat protein
MLGVTAASAAPPAQQRPSAINPASEYGQCLALARKKPAEALKRATAWRNGGGGFPADHCAAVALIGLKRYAEAAERLEALAGAMMGEPAGLRAAALDQAGQAWLLAGEAEKAKTAFDGALAFLPKDPDLLIDRAEAYAEGGRYWDAIDDLNDALAIAPKRADALIYRASAYRRVGGLDLALQDVQQALLLQPDSVPGLLERGNIRRLKGDLAGAKADWLKVEKLAPGSAAASDAKKNLAYLGDAPPASRKKK